MWNKANQPFARSSTLLGYEQHTMASPDLSPVRPVPVEPVMEVKIPGEPVTEVEVTVVPFAGECFGWLMLLIPVNQRILWSNPGNP